MKSVHKNQFYFNHASHFKKKIFLAKSFFLFKYTGCIRAVDAVFLRKQVWLYAVSYFHEKVTS